jgi:2,3-bisphosphoglycerate-dependent phosphoglycerate mutase
MTTTTTTPTTNESTLSNIMSEVHAEHANATEEQSQRTRVFEERHPRRTSFDMRAQPAELKKYIQQIMQYGITDTGDEDNNETLPIPEQLELSKFNPQIIHCRGMRILLVRHAESEANVDKQLLTTTSDYTIPLSQKGIKQSHAVGKFIRDYLKRLNEVYQDQWYDEKTLTPMARKQSFMKVRKTEQEEEGDGDPFTAMGSNSFSWDDESTDEEDLMAEPKTPVSTESESSAPKLKVRIWTSPYKRARQTAEAILSEAREYIHDYKEHVLLGEQQFGLFEGVPLDEIRDRFPNELAYFEKQIAFGGRFYATPPLGESRYHVAQRVYQTFSTFLYDAQTKGIKDIIVVAHGVTLRAFIMTYMNYSPEWFEKEENPNNASVRLLEGKHDRKYVYNGFN